MLNNKFLFKLSKLGAKHATKAKPIRSAAPPAPVEPNTEDPFEERDKLPDEPPLTTETIDKVLWALGEEWPGFVRPSMIGGCKRASYFHLKQTEQKRQQHDPKMVRTLKTGSLYHEMIQGFLGDSLDVYFAPESPVWDENLAIRGKCDGIVITRDLKYKWPIEIKTISDEGFKKLTKPNGDHVWQAHTYAGIHYQGWEGPKWIDIIYINKNNQLWKAFRIPYSPAIFSEIVDWVNLIHSYAQRNVPPRFDEKECDPGFCTFVDHCFKLKDREELARKAKAAQ